MKHAITIALTIQKNDTMELKVQAHSIDKNGKVNSIPVDQLIGILELAKLHVYDGQPKKQVSRKKRPVRGPVGTA